MRDARHDAGFSTLELIIALALVGLITAQTLELFSVQQRNAITQREVVEAQEDSRLVAEIMSSDVRMAGFMVPSIVAISSVDGGTGNPDRLCVSDAAGIDVAVLASASGRFDGAGLSGGLGAGDDDIVVPTSDLDIDDNGADDFAPDGGIIISDGTRSHCARITNVSGGTITFTPASPGSGFSVDASLGRAVPAVIYEVTGNGLERDGMVFASQVEDLQVEFGVDLDGDGEITGSEFPIHSVDNSEPDNVRQVRLSVVARTNRQELTSIEGNRPALANRTAGAPDTFLRRVITNTIAPRNLL